MPDGPVMCPWPVGEIVARLAASALSSRLRTSKPARILTGSGTGICPFLPLSKQRDRRSSARALSASGRSIPCAMGKRKGVCAPEGLDVVVSLWGKSVQMPGVWKNRQQGSAPQAVWCLGRDYTRTRGNGGAERDNCPKGQAKAGRNTAKHGEKK